VRGAGSRLAEEPGGSVLRALEAEHDPKQGGLASAVRSCDRHELALLDLQPDVVQDARTARVGEADVLELDC